MTRRTPKAHAAMTSAAMGTTPAQEVLNSLGSAVSLVVANQHAAAQIFNCQATFGVALSRLLRTPRKQGQTLVQTLGNHHQTSGSMPLTIQNIASHALQRAAIAMSAGVHGGTSMKMVPR